MNIAGDTRTISQVMSLLLQYLSAFVANNNVLPTSATIDNVTITGGSMDALMQFIKDSTNTFVNEDTSTYTNNKPLPVKILDRSSSDFLKSFQIADIDDDASPNYYGFERLDGKWYILKEDTSAKTYRYASGASAYSTAWTGRVGLTYGYLSALTW